MAKKNEISTQVKEGMKDGLNLQEISWCETYLRTLSIKKACSESGLRINEAQEMLRKESVINYIMMRSDQYRASLEREKEEELTRESLAKVLEGIILDPLANVEVKLRAIGQLNTMRQYDTDKNIVPEGEETKELTMSAEEAEALLQAMRDKNKK